MVPGLSRGCYTWSYTRRSNTAHKPMCKIKKFYPIQKSGISFSGVQEKVFLSFTPAVKYWKMILECFSETKNTRITWSDKDLIAELSPLEEKNFLPTCSFYSFLFVLFFRLRESGT